MLQSDIPDPRRAAWGLLLGFALPWAVCSAPPPSAKPPSPKAATAKPAPAALRIESSTELAGRLKYASDVRWASDKSLFLAVKRQGVVEVSLDPAQLKKGESLRQLIPGEKAPGGFWISLHLGASPSYLIAAGPAFEVTWRTLASAERRSEVFDVLLDVDSRGSKGVVLGARWDDQERFSPDGAIGWTFDLTQKEPSLKPIVFDVGGPGARSANNCGIAMVGVTRFLADGSLIVVPGVQPGLLRFDPSGKLQQTLDTVAMGLNSDCLDISSDLRKQMKASFPRRIAWLNERQVVDDILPLPEGPGLLIRRVREGQVGWVLKILGPSGVTRELAVPVQAKLPYARLKGDWRKGRLALVVNEHAANGMPEEAPLGQLLIATLPPP